MLTRRRLLPDPVTTRPPTDAVLQWSTSAGTREPSHTSTIQERSRQHLVFNFAGMCAWPLVLGIFGRPGDGKSFQVRAHLERRGALAVSINAADLESDRAGQPGKLVLAQYADAGHRTSEGDTRCPHSGRFRHDRGRMGKKYKHCQPPASACSTDAPRRLAHAGGPIGRCVGFPSSSLATTSQRCTRPCDGRGGCAPSSGGLLNPNVKRSWSESWLPY